MPSTVSKALPFFVVATLEGYAAVQLWPEAPRGALLTATLALVLAWTSLATGWVAVAYGLQKPTFLLKASPVSWLLLPFTVASATIARVARHVGVSERSEVAPGLWVGGWPSASSETWAQVDCTAELPRRGVASEYLCCPMLDGVAPRLNAMLPAVRQVLAWRSTGRTVLVHCAYGHGRSVIVASAAMVLAGDAPTVDAAIRHIKSLRPGTRFTASQRQAVTEAVEVLGVSQNCGYSAITEVKP